jgi:hypothetical protein
MQSLEIQRSWIFTIRAGGFFLTIGRTKSKVRNSLQSGNVVLRTVFEIQHSAISLQQSAKAPRYFLGLATFCRLGLGLGLGLGGPWVAQGWPKGHPSVAQGPPKRRMEQVVLFATRVEKKAGVWASG